MAGTKAGTTAQPHPVSYTLQDTSREKMLEASKQLATAKCTAAKDAWIRKIVQAYRARGRSDTSRTGRPTGAKPGRRVALGEEKKIRTWLESTSAEVPDSMRWAFEGSAEKIPMWWAGFYLEEDGGGQGTKGWDTLQGMVRAANAHNAMFSSMTHAKVAQQEQNSMWSACANPLASEPFSFGPNMSVLYTEKGVSNLANQKENPKMLILMNKLVDFAATKWDGDGEGMSRAGIGGPNLRQGYVKGDDGSWKGEPPLKRDEGGVLGGIVGGEPRLDKRGHYNPDNFGKTYPWALLLQNSDFYNTEIERIQNHLRQESKSEDHRRPTMYILNKKSTNEPGNCEDVKAAIIKKAKSVAEGVIYFDVKCAYCDPLDTESCGDYKTYSGGVRTKRRKKSRRKRRTKRRKKSRRKRRKKRTRRKR